MTAIQVTRQELYRQVWETPIVKLAERYDISGNGLAKICDRLKIPYPPRGYWARKAAGQNVIQYRLPEPAEDTPAAAMIAPSLPKPQPSLPSQEVIKSMEETKVKLQQSIGTAGKARPHPIIVGWREKHARTVKERRQSRNPYLPVPEPFSEVDLRRHVLLDALFKALESEGGEVTVGKRDELQCVMNGEVITFQLREKLKRVPAASVSTEKGSRSIERRRWDGNLKTTGLLVFTIKTTLPGNLRQEWLESADHPMERLMPEIAAVFVAAGPLLVEQRKQRAEEERQRQIAEHQRDLENERHKLDRNRWRRTVELAQQHREVESACSFLEALKSRSFDPSFAPAGMPLEDWLVWAEDWTRKGDPLEWGVKAVFEEIGSVTSWSYRE